MLDNSSLTQNKIYTSVAERIRNGTYKPGEKLSENNLAKEFKCSRTPVREAVKKLEQNGLVIIQPKSGTYIRQYTKDEIINALEIRAYLEACAFRLDIEKNVDLTPLKNCLKEMDKIAKQEPFDIEKFGNLHFDFHKSLVSLSGNTFLQNIYNDLHLIALYGVFFNPMDKNDLLITQEEHKKILKLIEDKDQEGQDFIIQHLLRRRNDFK